MERILEQLDWGAGCLVAVGNLQGQCILAGRLKRLRDNRSIGVEGAVAVVVPFPGIQVPTGRG